MHSSCRMMANIQTLKDNTKMMDDTTDLISTFQASFFSMSRINSFPWDALETELRNNRSAIVLDILNKTCLHSICRKSPPSVKYRKLFLAELIKRHETFATEPLDSLYDAFGEVVGAAEESICYKSYLMPSGDVISLAENVAVISEGTTGLVTWEAALYLAEWALGNPQVFSGRTVLELGSGAGMTGIAVCLSCNPNKYVFSDCHPSVLQRLHNNIKHNGLTCQNTKGLYVEEIDWESVSEDKLQEIGANTVIAADVVYDPEIASCLVRLLAKLLRHEVNGSPPDVYVASTIRNPETYNSFKRELEATGVRHQVIADPVTQVFLYNRVSSIEIMKLYV